MHDIQICIAMAEDQAVNFNAIMDNIIEKSLFTRKQIKIITDLGGWREAESGVSRGSYYRQKSQSKEKLVKFCYTVILLRNLDLLTDEDFGTIFQMAERISVIKRDDVAAYQSDEIVNVIDLVIKRLCDV